MVKFTMGWRIGSGEAVEVKSMRMLEDLGLSQLDTCCPIFGWAYGECFFVASGFWYSLSRWAKTISILNSCLQPRDGMKPHFQRVLVFMNGRKQDVAKTIRQI